MDTKSTVSGANFEQMSLLYQSKRKEGSIESNVNIIKELIYTSGRTTFEVFKQGTSGSYMDAGSFATLIKILSKNLMPEVDIKNVFDFVAEK